MCKRESERRCVGEAPFLVQFAVIERASECVYVCVRRRKQKRARVCVCKKKRAEESV